MPTRTLFSRRALLAGATALATITGIPAMAQEDPIKLGLVAALSGQSAKSGEAITRGIELALDEINEAGGVLGRRWSWSAAMTKATPARALSPRASWRSAKASPR